MKRIFQGMVLSVVVALGLTMSPAMAAAGSPQEAPALSAADQAFLAALATPGATPALELAAKRPVVGKDACSASVNCGNGTTVICTGTTASGCTGAPRNCAVSEHGHVTCNGVTTYCQNLCPCELLEQQCDTTCHGCYKAFSCSPSKCTCGPPCI